MELEHACAVSCPSCVGDRELVAMAISSPLLLGFNPSERRTFYLLLSISRFLSCLPSLPCAATSPVAHRPDCCAQASFPAPHVSVVMSRGTYVAAAEAEAGALPLRLASAIAPAWPDLRASPPCPPHPPHRLGRCGCHGDAGGSHRSALHAHTRARAPHHSLKIEGWPEQPRSEY